jgi:RNA polymerase-binding transcription factor DksA
MISEADKATLKKRLETEKKLLEQELGDLGQRNPSNPSDWVVAKPEGDEFGADRNDNADIIEDMVDDNASLNELEGRLNLVNRALDKMETGMFGLCEVSGEDIEMDRLTANPAAPTCKMHMM